MDNPEKYINYYYADNAKNLRKVVNEILHTFGDVPDKDDFYSIANEVFTDVLTSYDRNGHFHQYLKKCLTNKIKSEFTRRNRDKRMQYERNEYGEKAVDKDGNPIRVPTISLDACLQVENADDDDTDLVNLLKSDKNIEDEVFDNNENVKRYLDSLSKRQREIAELIIDGYKPSEIIEILGITKKEYRDSFSLMGTYDKRQLLERKVDFEENHTLKEGKYMPESGISEKTKNTSYSISSLCKKIHNFELLDNHPNQRSSDQWKPFARCALISDILQGKSFPAIVISEECIDDGRVRNWIIDGKQRCTTVDDYLHDGFAITKTVPRYMIEYQSVRKDEDGNFILDEQGFQTTETKTFDIRRKKFSQLPEELQDKFKDYQIQVTLNLHCTKEEIVYDISRYNRGRGMNAAQVGWTEMNEEYAVLIDELLSMDFFSKDCAVSNYQKSNGKTGSLRRMIVEGFVGAYYLDNFSKDVGVMCKFISHNAKKSEVLEFLQYLEELTGICTPYTSHLFTTKDSFLWFALYAKFKELGLEPDNFVEFLNEFVDSLSDAKIDGVSFNELNSGGTKDRSVVTKKITHLQNLMKLYFYNRGLLNVRPDCTFEMPIKDNETSDVA